MFDSCRRGRAETGFLPSPGKRRNLVYAVVSSEKAANSFMVNETFKIYFRNNQANSIKNTAGFENYSDKDRDHLASRLIKKC